MKKILFLWLISFLSGSSVGQTASTYTVLLQVEVVDTTSLKLTWNVDANATNYTINRKNLSDQTWGAPVAVVPGTDTMYLDLGLSRGQTYEYRIVKTTGSYGGYGYALAGIEVAQANNNGDALLLVEYSVDSALQNEIDQLIADLKADGWRVMKEAIDADTGVYAVKNIITTAFSNLPAMRMVYLLGHVPVPYSGNIAPDGHVPDHQGAWPADVYYAEINDLWTDQNVNTTGASSVRNQNIPGDGKFDQNSLPGSAELMIGRVDFYDLPLFSSTEIELTRSYLNRVHDYKMGNWTLPKRALIDDNFGAFGGEAFASNGWRNFSPLVGRNQIEALDYRTTLATSGYLFSYGCGGGSFTSAGGIGTSADFAGDSLQTGFTMLFGSYFGDWDNQNAFMRSALAQGTTMSISWAGRPHWHYHSLAMGMPIGMSALITQNNNNLYTYNYGQRGVHVALLGDPSLRMEYVAPPTALQVDTVDTFHIQVNWTASSDTAIDGYDIYQSIDGSPFFKLNDQPLNESTYVDSCVIHAGSYTYMVKAVKLEQGFSGSYWNSSLGVSDSVRIIQSKVPQVQSFGDVLFFDNRILFNSTPNEWVSRLIWIFSDTIIFEKTFFYYAPLQFSSMEYHIVIENSCVSDTLTDLYFWTYVSVEEINTNKFTMYPNPAASNGTIGIVGTSIMDEIELMQADGRVCAKLRSSSGKFQLPELAAGVYFVRAHGSSSGISKLIID